MKLPALVAAAALVLLGSACAATPTTQPSACPSFVLTGHPSYPPVAWADGSTLEGGGIDVVRRLAQDAHVGVRVVNEGTWDDAQLAVREGNADAIVGIYLTPARQTYLSYLTPALAPDPSAVLIRTGETFHYTNWNSLIGKRGVVGAGESYGPAFDAFLAAKLTTYRVPTLSDIYQQLDAGKADYGLSGYYAAVTTAPKTIAIAAPDFVTEGLYLAFGKQSVCGRALATRFSRDLATLVANGTVKAIFAAELARYEQTHPKP